MKVARPVLGGVVGKGPKIGNLAGHLLHQGFWTRA